MTTTTEDLQSCTRNAVEVVHDVFGTMLSIETWDVHDTAPQEFAHPVVGAVYFTGSWQGAILLECDREQAYAFTAKLNGMEPPNSVNDDVRDAMGEIANMVAGNLKSVLPPDTALSVPSVVEGSQYTFRVIGENDSVLNRFDSAAGPFHVTVVKIMKG